MSSSTALTSRTAAEIVEQVITAGDLARLTPQQRVNYYRHVCDSLGLNPLTRPFEYITLNGKLTLYARKDATDQIRKRYGVSITRVERETTDGGVYVVTAYAAMPDGRQDSDVGAVSVKGLGGDALANAYMKATTKAKRRVTLSICGLGMLDETEVETVRDATPVKVDIATGEIIDAPVVETRPSAATPPPPAHQPASATSAEDLDFPPSPVGLMAWLAEHARRAPDNAVHLINAVRQESGNPKLNFPTQKDVDGWFAFRKWALQHFNAPAAYTGDEAETEETAPAELPF